MESKTQTVIHSIKICWELTPCRDRAPSLWGLQSSRETIFKKITNGKFHLCQKLWRRGTLEQWEPLIGYLTKLYRWWKIFFKWGNDIWVEILMDEMLIRRKREDYSMQRREYTKVLKIQGAKRRSVGLEHRMRENQFYPCHHL